MDLLVETMWMPNITHLNKVAEDSGGRLINLMVIHLPEARNLADQAGNKKVFRNLIPRGFGLLFDYLNVA